METTNSFGYWIRRQRKALDLTQQVLAARVGCSLAAIKKIESDERKPSRQIAERMADVLGVSADQREMFLECARGLRPVDQLSLAGEPTVPTPTRRSPLPSGTVTFLYTDIDGSTKLAHQYRDAWEVLRKRHHAILYAAIEMHHGYIVQIIGDAFCAAFHMAGDAVRAAVKSQVDLQAENWGDAPIRVRMGIHTGKAEVQQDGFYSGFITLSHVQRVMSVGHGGQVLLSASTQELVYDELPEDVELRDMGERRLKDFERPGHLFQLNIAGLPSEFPPLNTLDSHRHNLPLQLTSFIGREREMAEVKYLLSATRLLTLTGAGGSGKTRLSIQVANELLDQYPDGVWIVELTPISDALLVPRTTAIAIGLRDKPQRPVIDMLCDYLRDKQLLLILDNCEHLVEACAQLADTLLHACPHIRILATSREALGIAGERLYLIPSLELPDKQNLPTAESLSQCEAVRLFIERASAATQNFTLTDENAPAVAQICHRLDGMPLAIELAAGKIRALSAGQIAQRLDDRFHLLTGGSRTALPRHQTLQAAIEWSYDLLPPAEQTLFRRLSVFVNGWTLEAAESVCSDKDTAADDALKTDDILELLIQLVNKSLVMIDEGHGEVRYHMLETIRRFGSNKREEALESESLHDRHLDYFLNLAEIAEPHLRRAEQLEWLAQLDADHENLRAALAWAMDKPSAKPALRLAGALGTFWDMRAYWLEGAKWLDQVLSKERDNTDIAEKEALAKALWAQGSAHYRLGESQATLSLAEQALAISTELNNQNEVARSLNLLGAAHYVSGRYAKAEDCWENALRIFQELGDRQRGMDLLNNLGVIADARGNYDTAFQRYDRALTIAREIGYRDGEIVFLTNRGGEQVALKKYEAAEADLRHAIQMAGITGYWCLPLTFNYRAEALIGLGNYQEAFYSARQALTLGEEHTTPEYIGMAWRTLGIICDHIKDVVRFSDWETHQMGEYEAETCFSNSVKVFADAEIDSERARTLREWARHEIKRGKKEHGATMWQEARDIFARLGAQMEVDRMNELLA